MAETLAGQFIAALSALEETKEVETLASLYAADASIGNLLVPDRYHGPNGAREFWTEYRGTFDQARSEFRNVIEGESNAALEWTTTGTSFENHSFEYSGVTILEFKDGKISRSCAYFDPSGLGRQIEGEK